MSKSEVKTFKFICDKCNKEEIVYRTSFDYIGYYNLSYLPKGWEEREYNTGFENIMYAIDICPECKAKEI